VDAVATKEDVAPEELSPPLYDVVDPQALDRLFDSTARVQRGGPGRVAFRYLGYTIRVRADGDVEVVDPEQ
jgi:hypothetical protein